LPETLKNTSAERIINTSITNDLFKMQLEGLVIKAIEEKFKENFKEKDEEIKSLKEEVEALEQHSRRNCIMIHGLKQREYENTDEMAIVSISLNPD